MFSMELWLMGVPAIVLYICYRVFKKFSIKKTLFRLSLLLSMVIFLYILEWKGVKFQSDLIGFLILLPFAYAMLHIEQCFIKK